MVTHVVMFRPRADLTAAQRRSLADALTTALTTIPSIRAVRVGRRVLTGRPYEQLMRTDYSHIALIEFDDVAGMHAYLTHPQHDELADRFFESFADALMYDYEIADGVPAIEGLVEP